MRFAQDVKGGKGMQKIVLGAIVGLGVFVLGALDARAEVREGKWTLTTVIKAAGMEDAAAEPQAAMQNMSTEDKAMMQKMMGNMNLSMGAGGGGMQTSITRCLTNDSPVPQMQGQEDCQTKHSMAGNTVHFETVCKDSTSTGDITYAQDSMRGTIQSHATAPGGNDATMEISGQYLGAC